MRSEPEPSPETLYTGFAAPSSLFFSSDFLAVCHLSYVVLARQSDMLAHHASSWRHACAMLTEQPLHGNIHHFIYFLLSHSPLSLARSPSRSTDWGIWAKGRQRKTIRCQSYLGIRWGFKFDQMKEGSPTFKNPSSPERRAAGTAFGSVVVSVVGEVKGGGRVVQSEFNSWGFWKGRGFRSRL